MNDENPLGSEEGFRGADDLSYSSPKGTTRQSNLIRPPPPKLLLASRPHLPLSIFLSMSDFLPLAWRERKTKIALLIVAF